jgi:hypothetical protein
MCCAFNILKYVCIGLRGLNIPEDRVGVGEIER